MSKRLRVRVAVVLPREDEVLLVRHVKKHKAHWCLPGGGVKFGESLEACGVRELKEEANLDIEMVKLLYVGDFIQEGRHVLDTFFLGRIVGGQMAMEQHGTIQQLQFVPFDKLVSMGVKPETVIRRIVEDAPNGFQGSGEYVGWYRGE